jgi:hypothetical protein
MRYHRTSASPIDRGGQPQVAPGADRGNQQLPAIPSGLCAAAGVALRCVALRCSDASRRAARLTPRFAIQIQGSVSLYCDVSASDRGQRNASSSCCEPSRLCLRRATPWKLIVHMWTSRTLEIPDALSSICVCIRLRSTL